MILSTFNIKNDYKYYKKDKSLEIIKYLIDNNIDILCLQEVFYKCDKDLIKSISNSYSINGNYRFRLKFLHPTDNEKNPIITNKKILFSTTYELPYHPSKLKRIVSHVVIDSEEEFSVYNTHLEARIKEVKEKQLDALFDIISIDKRPIILMGDFNLTDEDDIFKNFIKKLKSIGINKIDSCGNTFKSNKNNCAIDHIFISDSYYCDNALIFKNLNISDHYPIIVNIKRV